MLLYYFSNSFVVLTNKQLISMMGFKFPIFLTCMHMTATVFLSYLMLDVWEVFQKQAVSSKKQRTNITLLAVMFAVSLLCGNWSLKYIHVSFMQVRLSTRHTHARAPLTHSSSSKCLTSSIEIIHPSNQTIVNEQR